jgi:hypothetical protein
MDTVRFGRVLGLGARSAAKTLIHAVEAARAEGPQRTASSQPKRPAAAMHPSSDRMTVRQTAAGAAQTSPRNRGLGEGARQFHRLAIKPAARLTGALVLEIVGVFFGIFALYGANTMWRAGWSGHSTGFQRRPFFGGVAMLLVFGYFSISSFLRARRRERGR